MNARGDNAATQKRIDQADVLDWLATHTLQQNQAIVASIPDSAELPNQSVELWRPWFSHVAEEIVQRAPEQSPIIFYQSDVRYAGGWIDKSFLVQEAARKHGASLLLHRIVCRR